MQLEAAVTTGTIRGSSKEKLYQELSLDSLYHRRWFRKLCLFHKIYKTHCCRYLHELLPQSSGCYQTRQSSNVSIFRFKNIFYKNTFFPSSVIEWKIRPYVIRKALTFLRNVFSNSSVYLQSLHTITSCSIWVKYVKRLVLGLNCEYKIKHSFFDSSISIYSCGFDLQSTCYYLLHCPNLLSDTLSNINIDILSHDTTIVRIFLYGDPSLNDWLIDKLLIDKLTILLFL